MVLIFIPSPLRTSPGRYHSRTALNLQREEQAHRRAERAQPFTPCVVVGPRSAQ